jgi:hypothetical protein
VSRFRPILDVRRPLRLPPSRSRLSIPRLEGFDPRRQCSLPPVCTPSFWHANRSPGTDLFAFCGNLDLETNGVVKGGGPIQSSNQTASGACIHHHVLELIPVTSGCSTSFCPSLFCPSWPNRRGSDFRISVRRPAGDSMLKATSLSARVRKPTRTTAAKRTSSLEPSTPASLRSCRPSPPRSRCQWPEFAFGLSV